MDRHTSRTRASASLAFTVALALGAGLGGCAAARAGDPPRPAPANAAPVPAKPAEPAPGEVPAELLARIRADLDRRLREIDAAGARVELASAEEVIWPDGGLGCGKPGESYTMATVPGYRVVWRVGLQTYAYHATRAGYFKPCASGVHPVLPAPVLEDRTH